MAGRVLRSAAALGLAAATAGSLHALAAWKPPQPVTTYSPSAKNFLVDTAPGFQAAVLCAQPLSGAHLRSVRAQAEKDLARADAEGAEGDPAAVADLRLLLALLAARDGRTDEALQRYAEAARDAPFDSRPLALAYCLCVLAGRPGESLQWRTAYRRLVPGKGNFTPGLESDGTRSLIHELIIAAGLGGVYDLRNPHERDILMRLSCGEVDTWLVAALQDKTITRAERLQLSALRLYLHAKVWPRPNLPRQQGSGRRMRGRKVRGRGGGRKVREEEAAEHKRKKQEAEEAQRKEHEKLVMEDLERRRWAKFDMLTRNKQDEEVAKEKWRKATLEFNARIEREKRQFNEKRLCEARRARDREEEEEEDEKKRKGKGPCSTQ